MGRDTPAGTQCPTRVCDACSAILEQCDRLVDALDDSAYTADSAVLAGGTIGKHLRHLLDHVEAAACNGGSCIDYDHRRRGGDVETSRVSAREAIGVARSSLGGFDAADLEQAVSVRFMYSGSGEQTELRSTLGRELAFAMHHAIHHQAMMRAIAAEQGVRVPEGFGVAPDTLRHASQEC